MKNGNCLIGALILMVRLRTPRLHALTSIGPGGGKSIVPHFIVEDRNGNLWHYKRTRDLLPYPLCFFFFRGKFCRYKSFYNN